MSVHENYFETELYQFYFNINIEFHKLMQDTSEGNTLKTILILIPWNIFAVRVKLISK